MFAVFGKSKKKEFENSLNKLGVKIKDEEKSFAKDTGCYQISGDFSSEKIAMDFVELCKSVQVFKTESDARVYMDSLLAGGL